MSSETPIQDSQSELIIKVYGELLNSPKPERRKLFIETNPTMSLNELISVIDSARSWLKRFSYLYPTNMPWWYVSGCPFCKEAVLRNRDIITPLNEWKTAHCLRHSIIYFPNIATLIDNKIRVIRLFNTVTPVRMIYHTWSQKYMATYDISNHRAVAYWRKDGSNRVTRFVYRNHLDSYPLMSAFARLALNISRELFTLQLELEEPRIASNIYLNGELVKSLNIQS